MGETGEAGLSDFFKERFESDDSYVAQAEALRSLGKLGDRSAAGLLEEAAKMTSPRDVVKRAAEWALDQIRKNN